MKQFPAEAKFKHHWRKYQERVLKELDEHLEDNHLHIVAPPGSGKTILGLEVALRLNRPTLILAPTIAIRNQWVQRFCEFFLQTEEVPNWISYDIRKPEFLTVSTYQGLHSACSGKDDVEIITEEEIEIEDEKLNNKSNLNSVISGLKSKHLGAIIVDEAHHLKNAWWQSLYQVKEALEPTIVGLTATPPYDVSYAEWQRYIALNGPVDAEISVPELVAEGDLCPHQDYVFFSQPTKSETQKIYDYRDRIETLFDEVCKDPILIEAIANHPVYIHPMEHLDWIYNNLEEFSTILIFLNASGKQIREEHLEIIGDKNFVLPPFAYEWIEILLTFYLYKDPDNFAQYLAHQEQLIGKLRRGGAMERRSINFFHNTKVNRYLSSSISKLNSIAQIVDFEYKHLGDDLRMVILTDYIRKEFLVNTTENNLELNKIGVMPIFEKLRRTNSNKKLGVLTGSIIIIPVTALPVFERIAKVHNVDAFSTTAVKYDDSYIVIKSNEKLRHAIVSIITQVFQEGEIEILTGTKSLLGEGWDAPAINTLILASFVGSYVSSNQMRGRAIRTQRLNTEKTGNIWHLVCLDPTAHDGGDDMQLLRRRFKSFVGVSFKEEISIENGIDRLNIPEEINSEFQIDAFNENMCLKAAQREQLKQYWCNALISGKLLIEEIKVPFRSGESYQGLKSLYYNNTIKFLFATLTFMLITFGIEMFEAFIRIITKIKNLQDLKYWLLYAGVVGTVVCGGFAYRTFTIYIKYRDISKDIQKIGETLLLSLVHVGIVKTEYSKLKVISNVDSFGAIYCHLDGATTYEKSTFIKCLQEIIGPIDNPRYIIIRKSKFLQLLSQKDYHALPDIIGRKKANATYFGARWKHIVGMCELVYTRTIEGRKLVLKSRIESLAAQFQDETERVNKWR